MKNKTNNILSYKIAIILIVMVVSIFILLPKSEAFSLKLSANASSVNKGDVVTVNISADEKFVTSDFKLKYDSSVLEYVEETQSNLTIKDYSANGYLIAVYADLSGNGTNSIPIKFKAKASSDFVKVNVENQNFTTTGGTSLDSSSISSNVLEISVKDSGNNSNNNNDNSGNNNNSSNNGNNNSSNNNGNNNSNNNNSNSNNNNSNNNGNGSNSGSTIINNSSSNNSKTNTINATNNTNANGKLPYTGVESNIFISILIITAIIVSIILRKKIKYWKGIGMFIIAFSCTLIFTNSNIYAFTKTPKHGKYSNLIANQKVFAISLDKSETNREQKVSEISNLVKDVSYCKDSNGKKLENTNTIGTGGKVVLTDNTEYTMLLYGDVNGDGKVNSNDIYPIIKHILKEKELSGVYAKAANLNNKNDLNDANINSSDIYPIIKFILGDLSTDLVESFPDNADAEIEDLSLAVTYDNTNWTNKDVKVTIKSNKEIGIPAELSGYSAVLSSDKKQIDLTVKENINKNITIKDKDGISKNINIKVVNIDKIQPIVNGEIQLSKDQINKGEQAIFEIHLSASDNDSGVKTIKYRILKNDNVVKEEEVTSSQWVKYYFTPNVGENYKVELYAKDNAGNSSDKKIFNTLIADYAETDAGKVEVQQLQTQHTAALGANQSAIDAIDQQIMNLQNYYTQRETEIQRDYAETEQNLISTYHNDENEINSRYESRTNAIVLEKEQRLHQLEVKKEDDLANATSSEERAQIKAEYQNNLNEIQNSYNNQLNNLANERVNELANREQRYTQEMNENKNKKQNRLDSLINEVNIQKRDLEAAKTEKETEKTSIINDYNNKMQVINNKISIVKI